MRLRGLFAGIAVCLGAGLFIVGPASGQTAPSLSITPTSGPIGTTITATVTNCVGPNARLDFVIEGFTPANSETFTPAADGSATVSIQALDKEGQTENVTAASVRLSCQGQTSGASAPFTIIRQQATTSTTTATTSTTAKVTTTTVASQPATTTTTVRTAPRATPVAGRATFTG